MIKERSRREVMHHILSFTISRIYGEHEAENEYPRTSGNLRGFVSGDAGRKVLPGDLVLLSFVGVTKWQLGWLVELRPYPNGDHEYLIESLEDGTLCWVSNVDIAHLPRRDLRPQWRWTDRQWAFQDRWFRVCYKERHAYIVRPLMAKFGDGFEVTLGTRTSHAFDDIRPARSFPDWRKVTKAMMAHCYDELEAERDQVLAVRRADQEAQAETSCA